MVRKHHRIFRRLFLLISGLVLLLALLILTIGTISLKTYVKRITINSAEEKLDQKQYILEYTLNNIERTVIAMASDNDFSRYALLPMDVNDRYPVWKDIIDRMNDTMNAFVMIDSIYFYAFDREKDILSDKGVLSRRDFYDRPFINGLEEEDYNQWQDTRTMINTTLSLTTDNEMVMSYLQPVPAQGSKPRGLIVINIQVSALNRILATLKENDRIVLLNEDGMMMADSSDRGAGKIHEEYGRLLIDGGDSSYHELKDSGETVLVIEKEARKPNWFYFYFARDPYQESWLIFIKGLSLVTLIFLCAGTLAAYIISSRYTRPWEILMDEVIPSPEENEIGIFSETIHRLKKENEDFRFKAERNNRGYIDDDRSREMVYLERSMEKWKNGITRWEKSEFAGKTGKFIGEIEQCDAPDNYKELLLHEMTRFLLITLWRRNGSVRVLFGDDHLILRNMERLSSFDDKKKYFHSLADKIKEHLSQNDRRPQDDLMEDLLKYLNDHFREELYTDSMARRLNLSESYFCRLVKESTGSTFGELLGEIRYREVCRLLMGTDESLNDIAELTGLKNKRNLLRLFRKYSNDTPGHYRQINRLGQKRTLK